MKIIFFDGEDHAGPVEKVPSLGDIHKNGKNFLPSILMLERLLSGDLKGQGGSKFR